MPNGLRARMYRLMATIEDYGLEKTREPHFKPLDGKIWELSAKAAEGIARGLYVAVEGRRILILHAFEKKTEKTPLRALALARPRWKVIG